MQLRIRPLEKSDAEEFSAAFSEVGWHKPAERFLKYLQEEGAGRRVVRVATVGGDLAGYVTIQWKSEDLGLAQSNIPEIKDLNVLPRFRGQGVGSELLEAAEGVIALRSSAAGLRVGLHSGYGAAQRLYVKRGYVPDGVGAVDAVGNVIPEGATVPLDDTVTVRLVKQLDGSRG